MKLPTYVPAKAAPPDLPGNVQGLDPAYLHYPTDLVQSVATPPGDGEPITALTETFTTPPPDMSRNAYWQTLNKALGSDFQMDIATDAGDGYPAKFNTVIAGGTIPDLVWFPPNQFLQHVPELLEAKFHDLTPYLSGDAVKAYPNLANLPTYAWQTAVVNGKIWGVAVAYGRMGQVYLFDEDFWQPVGGPSFTSADDFLAKGKELLDVKRNKYVLELAAYNHCSHFAQWHGAPNKWRLEDGKLTYLYETDEWHAALEFLVKVAGAQLFWPDNTISTTTMMDLLQGGTIGAYVQSFPNYLNDSKQYNLPLTPVTPFPAAPGATPHWWYGYGSVGFTAISKQDDDKRVKTLLNVLNYLCAPMGTKERQLLDNGVEGVHYTLAGGDIHLTARGNAEVVSTAQPLDFLANGPQYLHIPSKPQTTSAIHRTETALMEIAVTDPTIGHYSAAYTNSFPGNYQNIVQYVTDLAAGHRSLSEWPSVLKAFQTGCGNQMRQEYEESLAKS
ncbi:hypothetical protein NGB36_27960 [Streptomyces sp. RB6PN25]|uniref:Sugar ABC transporter substrate-binding protein n=1 Tax=Streptomyces humicola TaxID=2953240 RepID=A0ABT1Q314_9ACTN|nr:hypothetical protein [Streptomyces humicola]MCQ4084311.1 hypothetical protein [Streptomyces humicola]